MAANAPLTYGLRMGYEIDFLPVGNSNGDAICLRYGGLEAFYVHVVDCGYLDTAERVIAHIEQYYGTNVFINNMVLTHADEDHASGLVGVLEHFKVQALWMNRPWLYAKEVSEHFHGNFTAQGLIDAMKAGHPHVVELEEVANKKSVPIYEAFQGAQIGAFTVLAPSRARYISLIPELDQTPTAYSPTKADAVSAAVELFKAAAAAVKEAWGIETLDPNPPPTSASNESCVVQFAQLDGARILLTADAGPISLNEAADYAASRGLLTSPTFVQIPHHGSRRNVTPAVLDRWLGARLQNEGVRGVAYVSVGKNADIYPRKKVKNAFIRRGYPVHATRGIPKSHFDGSAFPNRNWGASIPEPFSTDVED
jgi:beta-lactamase superfamily II metal-dependent hydrolase